MRRKKLTYILNLLVVLSLFSCASRKDIIYLQDLTELKSATEKSNFDMLKYKIDDRLTISISSLNPEAAQPYNLFATSFNLGGLASNSQQQLQSYLIDVNGEISFPHLGKLKLLGKTRNEVERLLEEKLKPFLPDAKANVQLVNFRISILGEVGKPGEYIVEREKINLFQAIGLAGDLTIHGKRDNIKLVREVNGKLKYYNIDLRKKNILTSEFYNLQQNDILYIPPNKPRVNASASSPTAQYIISATGLLVTIISILTR